MGRKNSNHCVGSGKMTQIRKIMITMQFPPLRWTCKKIARKSMALCTRYSGSLAVSSFLSAQPVVRVLTYHRFGESEYDPFCVSARHFEQQMAYLAEHKLAISYADFENYLEGKLSLSRNVVLVTVDDGFQSLHSIALPILKQHAIPAVAFVTPGLIRDAGVLPGQPGTQPEPYLDWEEIMVLADNNIAIGSHSLTHQSLGSLDENEVIEEAVQSRRVLENRLSRPVHTFAYPFGTKADFNDQTARILREAGYSCAFTSQHGAVNEQLNPYMLPRVKVEGGEAIWVFRSLVKGGLDAWRLIDQSLWRLQANRNA